MITRNFSIPIGRLAVRVTSVMLAAGAPLASICFQLSALAVPAYEGFDYPNDSPAVAGLAGGTGWAEPWVDNDADFLNLSLDDVSLSSPASPYTSIGDRVQGTGAGEASRLLTTGFDLTQEGSTFYLSFLLQKVDGSAPAGDNVEVTLNAGLSVVLRYGASSTETFFLGSSANLFGTLEIGDTYFMVLKGVSSTDANDEFFVKVYADTDAPPTAEPTTWDTFHSGLGANANATIDTIRLVRGANATGAFDEIRVGSTWADVAGGETLPSADFNGDGDVDGEDLEAWKMNFGTATEATLSMGDADDDDDVDGNDYLIWQRALDVASPEFGAVPEPGSLMLAALGCLGVGACRLRTR